MRCLHQQLVDFDRAKNGLEKDEFDKRYLKLKKDICFLLDEVATRSATSKQLYMMTRDDKGAAPSFLRKAASNCSYKWGVYYFNILTKEKKKLELIRVNYLMAQAGKAIKTNDIADALDSLKVVVSKFPDESEAGKLMEKIISLRPGSINTTNSSFVHNAIKLRNDHRFKPVNNFTHVKLKRPFSIVLQKKSSLIWVSDSIDNSLYCFSRQGHYKSKLKADFNNPCGLIKESDNRFWICDTGNRRLVECRDGKPGRTILLNHILGSYTCPFPLMGKIHEDIFHLIAMNKTSQKRCLITLKKERPNVWQEIIPVQKEYRLTGIAADSDIFFSDYFSKHIFRFDNTIKKTIPFGEDWLQTRMSALATHNQQLFIAADNYLLKYTKNGTRIFECALKQMFKEDDERIEDITIAAEEKREVQLFISAYSPVKNTGRIYQVTV